MSEILYQPNDIVVPGEILAKGMDFLPSAGTYRNGENIQANMLGLVKVDGKVIKLIPLSGRYNPKFGDTIVGYVTDILMSGWRFNINCGYSAVLSLQEASNNFIKKGADLTKFYGIKDLVVCTVTNVTTQKLIDISMKGQGLRKLVGGRVMSVTPVKVPRIIGKQGSMVSMIKDLTKSKVVVGQNGWVWISNDDPKLELKTAQAIELVENNSHISGLTDKVKEFLS